MNWYYSGFPYSDELYHHGIKNQKWGLRRYQNEDGSLTALGRIHYGVGKARDSIVTAYKRKHPGLMNDDELTAEINRQKKLNELKKARDEGRRGSAGERAKEVMWKGLETGTKEAMKASANKLGEGLASRILETNQQKRLRELNENIDIQKASEKLRSAYEEINNKRKQQRDDARAAKEAKREAVRAAEEAKAAEERARRQKKTKDRYDYLSRASGKVIPNIDKEKTRDWRSSVSNFPSYEFMKEQERRRRLYGPSGTAYK